MLKRALDLTISAPAALLSAPFLALILVYVWLQDRKNPLYVSYRIGKDHQPFRLFKVRTMVVGADRTGVDTTIKGDPRLLPFADILRRYKLDELPQFWNVISGHMSLVGPRPNVAREVEKYSLDEQRLLEIKPGLTDFASIVFSDLSERLAGQKDANLAYETLIRPAKSCLSLFYVDNHNIRMDVVLIVATAVSIVSKKSAIHLITEELRRNKYSSDVIDIVEGGDKNFNKFRC